MAYSSNEMHRYKTFADQHNESITSRTLATLSRSTLLHIINNIVYCVGLYKIKHPIPVTHSLIEKVKNCLC